MKLALCFLPIFLTGCATSNSQYYQSIADSNEKQVAIADARARAETERYRALTKIAENGDPATKSAVAMALALTGRMQLPPAIVPQQPRSEALQWASVLVPSITNLGVGYYNAMTQRRVSDNARSVAVSTNEAFVGMASHIQAPAVVMPQANVATTTTTTTNDNDVTETVTNETSTTTTTTDASTVGDYSGQLSDTRFDSDNIDSTHAPAFIPAATPVVVIPDGFTVP